MHPEGSVVSSKVLVSCLWILFIANKFGIIRNLTWVFICPFYLLEFNFQGHRIDKNFLRVWWNVRGPCLWSTHGRWCHLPLAMQMGVVLQSCTGPSGDNANDHLRARSCISGTHVAQQCRVAHHRGYSYLMEDHICSDWRLISQEGPEEQSRKGMDCVLCVKRKQYFSTWGLKCEWVLEQYLP